LPGGVSRRPQRITSAGSGGRRDTLWPPPLLRLLLVLLYSQFGD